MKVVGLTGGIASGKSTVKKFLQELGILVLDTDELAHEQLLKGSGAWHDIVSNFGEEILQENGDVDRNKLGDIIFADNEKRKILEGIVHPLIKKIVQERLLAAEKKLSKLVCVDIPLLFEVGWQDLVDEIWVVYVTKAVQLARLIKRNALDEKTALRRIEKQLPMEEKCRKADFVIDNMGTFADTHRRVKELVGV